MIVGNDPQNFGTTFIEKWGEDVSQTIQLRFHGYVIQDYSQHM